MQYHFTSVQRLIQIRCLFGFYFWRGFGRGVKSQEEMLLCCWRNKMKLDSATFSVCGKFEGLGGGGRWGGVLMVGLVDGSEDQQERAARREVWRVCTTEEQMRR